MKAMREGSQVPHYGARDPITKWPGIGPKRAQEFANLGVHTLEDLLGLWPHRHEDRRVMTPLDQVHEAELMTVQGIVQRAQYDRFRQILRIELSDGRGTLSVVFFHAAWLQRQLPTGQQVVLTGKVERRASQMTMVHPEVQTLKAGEPPLLGLVPIYPLSGSIRQGFLQRLMKEVVPRLAPQVADPVPVAIQERYELIGRAQAVLYQHFPPDLTLLEASRKRLVFDEFLRIALAVQVMHHVDPEVAGLVQNPDGPMVKAFLASLPFELTPGQQKAWETIQSDLREPRPMARLLQGDVGSGKTVVAILTMLAAVDAGHQAAFMAPTELLAEQQWQVLHRFLEPLGVPCALLTGRDKQKAAAHEALQQGTLPLVVGTQALIAERVGFSRLGVVVVDEQHRFGVKQRARLSLKGTYPDMLVMTATPIPRTLALTVYGDLDVSEITGLPPGRQPVETVHVTHERRKAAYTAIRQAVMRGEQAYVVCPLVQGDDENGGAKAAVDLARGMEKVPGWRIGLLHGKMSSGDKSEVMARFRAHEIDVLVATTIVEVGVDVPNATVMVVEDADRFGLAQLHQLRGRVGRGNKPAQCFLIADPRTEQARERLQAMVQYHEGIKLAEEDLRIRGPGEVLGMRQHGITGFQLANPVKDLAWLQEARQVAVKLVADDPHFAYPEHKLLWQWVRDALDDAMPSQVLH